MNPFSPPNRFDDLPRYPPLLQALRVLGGTVSGPSGYMSSSVLGPSLYLAVTQQLDPNTLLPRDREPCFALDLNRYGLVPGYYTNCRLAGSYQSLPVYEIGGAAVSPMLAFSQGPLGANGLTQAQILSLLNLAPTQLAVLNNLSPCQLQVLLTALPPSQIQTLTTVLTPTQLTYLTTNLTTTQLTNLYTQLTTSQVINLSAIDPPGVQNLTDALTPAQIQQLITGLTAANLEKLSLFPKPLITSIVGTGVTTANINTMLTALNEDQVRTLTEALTPTQITNAITGLTSTELRTLGGMTPQQAKLIATNLSTAQQQSFLDTSPLPWTVSPGVNAQTGTTYTVLSSDAGKLVTLSNASAIAVTLPNAATLGPGFFTYIQNIGTGTATLTPASGTINGASSLLVPAGTGTFIFSDGTNYKVHTPVAGATGAVRTEETLAAAGTTISDAAQITADAVYVTNADSTNGIKLPDRVGGIVIVYNDNASAFNLLVYPPNAGSLFAGSTAGTAQNMPALEAWQFSCIKSGSSGIWKAEKMSTI